MPPPQKKTKPTHPHTHTPIQPDAYEFSIRTPVTPARWDDYDEVTQGGWAGMVLLAARWLPTDVLA
jgi:hypothetical protein